MFFIYQWHNITPGAPTMNGTQRVAGLNALWGVSAGDFNLSGSASLNLPPQPPMLYKKIPGFPKCAAS